MKGMAGEVCSLPMSRYKIAESALSRCVTAERPAV